MKRLRYLSSSITASIVAITLLLPLTSTPVLATPISPGQGISFEQVAFDYSGLSPIPFSQYGTMFADYSTLNANGFSSGFINVISGGQWIVQNLPVSAASGYPGLSVMFDLGLSANGSPVTGLNAYSDFSATPWALAPTGAPTNFDTTNGNFSTTLVTNAQETGPTVQPIPGRLLLMEGSRSQAC